MPVTQKLPSMTVESGEVSCQMLVVERMELVQEQQKLLIKENNSFCINTQIIMYYIYASKRVGHMANRILKLVTLRTSSISIQLTELNQTLEEKKKERKRSS
jgi:hypothetical protein